MNKQEMVQEFHEVFDHLIQDKPNANVDISIQSLRYDLIYEELRELNEAMLDRDIVEVADAIADLLYVVYGTAVSYGINIEPVFEAVHKSNMDKIWPDGELHYHPNGKVKKPEGWEPPNIKAILKEQE